MGHHVSIITLRNQQTKKSFEFPQITAPTQLSTNLIIRSFQLANTFLKLIIRGSWPSLVLFYKLERSEKIRAKKILAKIYANFHFFICPEIEVLIFGYGNLIIERENLAKALGAKMVAGFQGSDLKVFPLNQNQNIFRKGLQKLDVGFFRNQYLLQLAQQHGMPRNKPAFIIFNKIDTSFFQPKSDLGQLNTPLKILTVGRLHWIKGFPHLLKALALFEGRGINWKLRIIGEGVEKEHLFYTAMGLGILDKVNFLGGKTQEDVKTEMMDSDIFINSSFFESNCRALLEAQAAGLLVVSNHWPEAEKIVIHEKTGWLIPKHDPGAIADQVEKIVALPLEKRKAVAKNAINHVQQNFNLKDATKDFEQLLKQ